MIIIITYIISLACVSSETYSLQTVIFSSYLVHKTIVVVSGVPTETWETGNKNRCVTEAKHVLRRKLRFRAFPFAERVCPRILSLESADYFGTSEHFTSGKKEDEHAVYFWR